MALLTEILDYLQTQGVIAGATGWARAASELPPDPDKVICVYETPGPAPELEKASGVQEYDEPGFQVRGRGDAFGYEALRTKMGEVYAALHGAQPTSYIYIEAVQSGPMPMGKDASGRPHLTWNFRAMRERS